jgi:hypothetical protein
MGEKGNNHREIQQIRATNILDDRASSRANTRPEIGALLADRTVDLRALHFAFFIHHHASVIY